MLKSGTHLSCHRGTFGAASRACTGTAHSTLEFSLQVWPISELSADRPGSETCFDLCLCLSGWGDLNSRPSVPQSAEKAVSARTNEYQESTFDVGFYRIGVTSRTCGQPRINGSSVRTLVRRSRLWTTPIGWIAPPDGQRWLRGASRGDATLAAVSTDWRLSGVVASVNREPVDGASVTGEDIELPAILSCHSYLSTPVITTPLTNTRWNTR